MEFDRWTDERLLHAPPAGAAGRTFEAFYCRHERLIAAYHLRRVPDPETAADLTAETFAQALESRVRFEPRGPGSAGRWLYGIAANVRSMSVPEATIRKRVSRGIAALRKAVQESA